MYNKNRCEGRQRGGSLPLQKYRIREQQANTVTVTVWRLRPRNCRWTQSWTIPHKIFRISLLKSTSMSFFSCGHSEKGFLSQILHALFFPILAKLSTSLSLFELTLLTTVEGLYEPRSFSMLFYAHAIYFNSYNFLGTYLLTYLLTYSMEQGPSWEAS